jgi:hypothetical protein
MVNHPEKKLPINIKCKLTLDTIYSMDYITVQEERPGDICFLGLFPSIEALKGSN